MPFTIDHKCHNVTPNNNYLCNGVCRLNPVAEVKQKVSESTPTRISFSVVLNSDCFYF